LGGPCITTASRAVHGLVSDGFAGLDDTCSP